ncbi:MAG: glycosyltransferase family 2 protein [Chlorobaculum sp.]
MVGAYLTVAVCTHNRCQKLRITVRRIIDACCGNPAVCVLIVDNASTDLTCEYIEELIKYGKERNVEILSVREEKLGISAARNRAIEYCETELLGFVDDDAFFEKEWIEEVINAFKKEKELVACGGPISPDFEIPPPYWFSEKIQWVYSINNYGESDRYYRYPEHPIGVNMAFRAKILKSMKFDEKLGRKGSDLISWEESKLFKEIMNCGIKVKYLAKANVVHLIPAERLNFEWVKDRCIAEGRSKAVMLADGYGFLAILWAVVKLMVVWFGVMIFYALSFDEKNKCYYYAKAKYASGFVVSAYNSLKEKFL